MIYEVVNPSDACTIESDDALAACLACIYLGNGQYALRDEKDEQVCPLFILGGDPEAWLKETHGMNLESAIASKAIKVAECLESFMYGRAQERAFIKSTMAKMSPEVAQGWLGEWQEQRRTSSNNIGKRAAFLAKQFREHAQKSALARAEGKDGGK